MDEDESLHSAAWAGVVDAIKSLLSRGFSIDRRDDLGRTPLMIAADNDKLHAVTYLLEKGADPSLQDNSGWNALHQASRSGIVAIMEKILSYGVDIESKTIASTPLMLAKRYGNSDAVDYLLGKVAESS